MQYTKYNTQNPNKNYLFIEKNTQSIHDKVINQ